VAVTLPPFADAFGEPGRDRSTSTADLEAARIMRDTESLDASDREWVEALLKET
jgi:hypothetical protein